MKRVVHFYEAGERFGGGVRKMPLNEMIRAARPAIPAVVADPPSLENFRNSLFANISSNNTRSADSNTRVFGWLERRRPSTDKINDRDYTGEAVAAAVRIYSGK